MEFFQINGPRREPSGLLEAAVELTGDLHVNRLTATHVGVGRLNGGEDTSEFAGLGINPGDGEGHGAGAIDVALDVLAVEFVLPMS